MKKLSEMILVLSEIYGEEITESRLSAYTKVLDDLKDHELDIAFKSIMNNPWIKKLPLPSEIRNAARPELKPKEEAIQRLTLIKQAVKNFGWPNPIEAKEFLGDIIWSDIERLGGWKYLCESPSCNINNSIIYAQLRDGIASSISARRNGIDFQIPTLSAKQKLSIEGSS